MLTIERNDSVTGRRLAPTKGKVPLTYDSRTSSVGPATIVSNNSHGPLDSVGRQNIASAIDQHGSGRRSLSESLLTHPNPGNVSLRKQLHNEDERLVMKITKNLDDETSSQVSLINSPCLVTAPYFQCSIVLQRLSIMGVQSVFPRKTTSILFGVSLARIIRCINDVPAHNSFCKNKKLSLSLCS